MIDPAGLKTNERRFAVFPPAGEYPPFLWESMPFTPSRRSFRK
jgi:hypothetical protein